MSTNGKWNFWIDRGGTFTDIIAQAPDGTLTPLKLLSENPSQYGDAALYGIRQMLQLKTHEPIPKGLIDTVKWAPPLRPMRCWSKKGEPLLLLTTKGYGDSLEIGHQARPDIFARKIKKPKMLYQTVAEVDERILADGTIETKLDPAHVTNLLQAGLKSGLETLAVLFMHAVINPLHEQQVGKIARRLGFKHISLSHEYKPACKIYSARRHHCCQCLSQSYFAALCPPY